MTLDEDTLAGGLKNSPSALRLSVHSVSRLQGVHELRRPGTHMKYRS